jgi:hypothetical protein
MIEFRCPSCARTIKLPDSLAGKQGRCPSCGQAVTAPPPATVQSGSTTPEPSPVDGPVAASEPQPAPQTQVQPVPTSRVTVGRVVGGLIVLALVAALMYYFVPGVRPLPEGTVTRGMYDQIEVGMTSEQVESILGLPTEHNVDTNGAGILYVEDRCINYDESSVVISYTIVPDAWIVSDKKAFNIPY